MKGSDLFSIRLEGYLKLQIKKNPESSLIFPREGIEVWKKYLLAQTWL